MEFNSGTVPNGMNNLPASGNTWPGTPNQTGVYQFSVIPTDAWGNEITDSLTAYILSIPQITNVNPASAAVGSNGVTLTISGSGFVAPASIDGTQEAGSTVAAVIGNAAPITLTPSSFSANQLTVNLPASLLTSEGLIQLSVSNPGVTTSNTFIFAVEPVITSLSTYIRTAGTAAFPLGVTGAGFAKGAQVLLNGAILPTVFVNSTSLTATVPTIAAPGAEAITVVNPDETYSAAVTLTVVPAPSLISLNPSSVNAGGPAFTLTLTGSHFLQGMIASFNGTPLAATLVPNQRNNQLMATVPASAIAQAGTVPVWVTTVDAYATNAVSFSILSTGPPPLQLTTLSPLPVGMVNTAYSTTLMTSGGAGGNTFSITSGALPAGLQLSASGVIGGTPTAYGPSQFTVQVTDSAGNTVSRAFSINIAPAPLMLTTGPLANTLVSTAINIQFTGSGGIPPYTFVEFGALPPGVSISNSGLLSGTPTKAGSYPFLLFIDDTTEASASKNYVLNVALPGLLITPPSPLPSGQINVPYTTQLAATGGVGPPYTWSATGLPPGLAIANTTGSITGIPRASGTFTIAVTVGDSSGAAATQNYTLAIAAATLTFSIATIPNGAIGISYSSTVTVTGGTGPYTFTAPAASLPPGLTLQTNGTLSGTPTTAGTYTIAVTATDSTGATVSGSFTVTIAPQLVVTPATIPNATLGTAISPVQLAASGGVPPYRWQSANVPPGLTLALNGTLSGTPAAAGTFSFTVYVVDNNASLASGMEQLTVGLPTTAAATITGLPASAAPATQPSLNVTLINPYPATITANLTLTFAPASGADDPAIQFITGGRTAQIVIPAGDTSGIGNIGVQTGTVAGTITITAQLLAGTANVTPTPAPSTTIVVPAGAPVITAVSATRTSTGFTVTVTGYASNRDVDTAAYQFSPSEGSTLTTTQVSTPVTSLFTQWYGGSSAAQYGSQFTLTQAFTVNGSASSVFSVSVTLMNALGTSTAASAFLQ
jgi:hypothetical protein